jgi:hypothetical protein
MLWSPINFLFKEMEAMEASVSNPIKTFTPITFGVAFIARDKHSSLFPPLLMTKSVITLTSSSKLGEN